MVKSTSGAKKPPMLTPLQASFAKSTGSLDGTVEVDISYAIIQHISRQLYTNPRKAIEELVCNSYDAGASECHVTIPGDPLRSWGVLDNGVSMDLDGLRNLWRVAASSKRQPGEAFHVENDRIQIGKFGVGKLAAFALGDRLTHVTCVGGWTRIVSVSQSDVHDDKGRRPTFQVHKLRDQAARKLLEPALGDLPRPWERDWDHWTLALVSDIDPAVVGPSIKIGYLRRMIQTSIPISARFGVYLNADLLPRRETPAAAILLTVRVSSEAFRKQLEPALESYWRLNSVPPIDEKTKVPTDLYKCSIGEIPNPEDPAGTPLPALLVPGLGGVAGDAIIAKDSLTTEKLQERGYRDNGFAVCVHGKLVNPEDDLFGVTPRSLGYWGRFRASVEIPGLDPRLLVQRNGVAEGARETHLTRELLRSLFEMSRHLAEEKEGEDEQPPETFGARLQQINSSAGTMALRGLAGGKIPEGGLSRVDVVHQTLGEEGPAGRYDSDDRNILVNDDHPILSALEGTGSGARKFRRVLSETIASTIMSGGFLLDGGVEPSLVEGARELVDDALRAAARHLRNPIDVHIEDVEEASYAGGKPFEDAVVRAFRALRLATAGDGRPDHSDGIIELKRAGQPAFKISIEAKGSRGVVTHEQLSAATISRHREEDGCTHAIAIAREFQTAGVGKGKSGLIKETAGKVPLLTTANFALLLRLNGQRPFSSSGVAELLTTWRPPSEMEAAIRASWSSLPPLGLLTDVLDVGWEIQQRDDDDYPDAGRILEALQAKKKPWKRPDIVKALEAVEACTKLLIIYDRGTYRVELLAPPDTLRAALVEAQRALP